MGRGLQPGSLEVKMYLYLGPTAQVNSGFDFQGGF